ncbi:MAG: GNAT family N-acetyltransferase [Candidatus Thorarchaeota archaeon]
MLFSGTFIVMGIEDRALIRFAGPEDLEWCVVEDSHVTEKIIRNKIVNDEIIVVELDGQLIGYIRLEYLWSTTPYIGLIFVIDKYRNGGIGRKMVDYLEHHLRANGHDELMSSSQANEPEPQAWHRAIGFEECGIINGLNEGGIGEIFFRKKLT